VGTYQYTDLNHKHAVTSAGGNTYTYDGNGNMMSGAKRNFTWTSFNKPSEIWTNNYAESTSFAYDANHNRIAKYTPDGKVTRYVGKIFEQTTLNGLTSNTSHIYAGSKLIASITKDVTGLDGINYLHSDHLGSISVITDSTGAVVERLRFDVFGAPVNLDGTSKTSFGANSTSRGYTGHEMDSSTGLINMNARLYDPVLGRFISADTVVPEAGDMQAFNRYSYVLNNPLMYTDPSGHIFFLAATLLFSYAVSATTVSWFVAAMVMGVVGYITSEGNLKAGLISAASVGFSRGIGDIVAKAGLEGAMKAVVAGSLHALKGGVLSMAGGDDFLSGALAGGIVGGFGGTIGEIDGDFSQIVVAGVLGGVASIAGGGRFSSGFITGAFTHAFNEIGHKEKGTVSDKGKLDTIDSKFKSKVDKVFKELTDKGYNLRVVWGKRTLEQNNKLVAKGHAVKNSLHLKGLAVDFVERSIGYDNANHPQYVWDVLQAAENAGVTWGGYFNKWDPNHIEAR